jgi:hypothetical protein
MLCGLLCGEDALAADAIGLIVKLHQLHRTPIETLCANFIA